MRSVAARIGWWLRASCRDRRKPREPPAASATKGVTQGETG
jgi:hypothetical protein